MGTIRGSYLHSPTSHSLLARLSHYRTCAGAQPYLAIKVQGEHTLLLPGVVAIADESHVHSSCIYPLPSLA